MRVRYRNPAPDAVPSKERSYFPAQETFLSPGSEYEVFAVSVYDDIAFVQIVDDVDTPTFKPRSLFDVVDTNIPADWICNVFPSGPVQLVMGPAFIARDLDSYNGMIDMDEAQFHAFWQRVRAIEQSSR